MTGRLATSHSDIGFTAAAANFDLNMPRSTTGTARSGSELQLTGSSLVNQIFRKRVDLFDVIKELPLP